MPDPNTVPRDPATFGYTKPATDDDVRAFAEGMNDPLSAWSLNSENGRGGSELGRYDTSTAQGLGPEVDNATLLNQSHYATEQPSPATTVETADEIDYRKRYGDVQNQLGAERAAYEAKLAESLARQNELAARLLAQTQTPPYITQQPTMQYVQPPQQVSYDIDLFPGREDGHIPTKAELNESMARIMRDEWTPALRQVQANAYQAAVATVQRQSGKINYTPLEAQAVLTEVPSLNYLPPAERDMAVQRIAEARRISEGTRSVAPMQPTTPQIVPVAQPQRTVAVDPRRVMTQATYVESSAPASVRSAEPPSPDALQRNMAAEFANCKTAADMEAFFIKYNVKPASDWSGPVATR